MDSACRGQEDALARYKHSWQRRLARHEADLVRRSAEGRKLAADCAEWLASRFAVKRVILIGSLSGRTQVTEHSDIDLVVEGLRDDEYFTALGELVHRLPKGWDLDLILWEDADASMRAAAEAGEVLYEEPS